MKDIHHCPACGRAFKSILDYPRIRVLSFERLGIPEAIDYWSAAATAKRLARQRIEPPDSGRGWQEGINVTPAIVRACDTKEVQSYLSHLAALPSQQVAPDRLLPPLQSDRHFKWVYPIPGTGIYLSLADAEVPADEGRIAEIQVHCEGPNLGSAGGPTLQPLGAIARLRYEGLLRETFRPSGNEVGGSQA